MNRTNRILLLVSALLTALLLAIVPAAATEGGEGGGGAGDEREKIELPSNPHDQVGLVLIVLLGLGTLLALDNARRQLKGERKQASGEWRWR